MSLLLVAGVLALPWIEASPAQAADRCAAPANVVDAENCKPGSDKDVWDVDGSCDPSNQGFATDVSVTAADVVRFKVKANAQSHRLDIYRMGYYGGMGARLAATIQPCASLLKVQPNCVTEVSTGLVGCGVDNAPLHALASGVDGLNGVFKYGAAGTFPTDSFNSANYWADVVISTGQ